MIFTERLLRPRVLFFYAEWCGPSQAFKIVLNRAVEAYKGQIMPPEYFDTDHSKEDLLKQYKILGIPTTILLSKYSKELGRLVGYNKYDHVLSFLHRGVL